MREETQSEPICVYCKQPITQKQCPTEPSPRVRKPTSPVTSTTRTTTRKSPPRDRAYPGEPSVVNAL